MGNSYLNLATTNYSKINNDSVFEIDYLVISNNGDISLKYTYVEGNNSDDFFPSIIVSEDFGITDPLFYFNDEEYIKNNNIIFIPYEQLVSFKTLDVILGFHETSNPMNFTISDKDEIFTYFPATVEFYISWTNDSIIIDYVYKQELPWEKDKGYFWIKNKSTGDKKALQAEPGAKTIIFDSNTAPNILIAPWETFQIGFYTEEGVEQNIATVYDEVVLDSSIKISDAYATKDNNIALKYDFNDLSNGILTVTQYNGSVGESNKVGSMDLIDFISPSINGEVIITNSILSAGGLYLEDGNTYEFLITQKDYKGKSNLFTFEFISTKDPELTILEMSAGNDWITIKYDYLQGFPWEDEELVIDVYNTVTKEKGSYNKELWYGIQIVTLDASTVDGVSFNSGDKMEITMKVINVAGKDLSIDMEINLQTQIIPTISIEELTSSYDSITLFYKYKTGSPIADEKGYLKVTNKTTGEYGNTNIQGGNVERRINIDKTTFPTVSFNPGDEFLIELYTEGAYNENNVIPVTQEIKLATYSSVTVNDIVTSIDYFVMEYTFIQGSKYLDWLNTDIKNLTTGQTVEYAFPQVNESGTYFVEFSSLTVPGMDFNEGDKFEISLYTTGLSSEVAKETVTTSLLKSPKVGLEANYDNEQNPTSLTIKTYYIETNDANRMDMNVILYDRYGKEIDGFSVRENEELVINLLSYESIGFIDVSYTWTNLNNEYVSSSSNLYDEYIGNGFDLINTYFY